MSVDQAGKGHRFQALHSRAGAFVLPNPWDAGTARILTSLGFEALTTTSAGLAFALGRPDGAGAVSRDETLANAKAIVDATDLPVAADLENGFGDSPAAAAETIRLAGEVGLVGGSIEDATGDPQRPIYDFNHAVERVAAAVEAARGLAFPFVMVGRAENLIHGRLDLDDTIRRLQAFEAAGADVLYAPGLTKRGRHSYRLHIRPQAGQRRHGLEGRVAVGRGARITGSAAYQPGLRAQPRGARGIHAGREGDSRPRHVPLFGGRYTVR